VQLLARPEVARVLWTKVVSREFEIIVALMKMRKYNSPVKM
jgi:hypothetical protein